MSGVAKTLLVAAAAVALLAPADAQSQARAVDAVTTTGAPCPPEISAHRLALDVSAASGPVATWILPADPPPYWYVTFYVPPGADGWTYKAGPVAGHKTEIAVSWFNGVRPPSGSLITATVAPATRAGYKYRRGAHTLVQAEVPDTPPAAIPKTPGFDTTPDVAGNDVTIWWYESARALTYTIQRATTIGPDSDWQTLDTVSTLNYTDWDLPPGRYYYRIRANNHEGSSGWGSATNPVTIEDS